MSDLSKDQLAELGKRVNDRIAEWEFPHNHSGIVERLPLGVVRLVFDVIDEWHNEECWQRQDEPEADDPELDDIFGPNDYAKRPDAAPVTNGNGAHLSEAATATLGPEHTTITPLNLTKPRTLAEVDVDLTDLRLGSEEKAALLREIIGELQVMSQHDEMPTMAAWDAGKPTHLPKGQTICFRYQIGWERLAEYARLKFERKNKAKE